MDQLVLPDTNILIQGLAGNEPYASFLRKLIEEKRLVLSAICVAEFLTKATDEEEKIVSELFSAFPVLEIDLTTAKMGALYRKKYLEKDRRLKLPDCLIAATAKIHKVALATLNRKDYPMTDIEFIEKF